MNSNKDNQAKDNATNKVEVPSQEPVASASQEKAEATQAKAKEGLKGVFSKARKEEPENTAKAGKARPSLKEIFSVRENQALGLSVLALAISLISLAGQNNSAANAFIEAENSNRVIALENTETTTAQNDQAPNALLDIKTDENNRVSATFEPALPQEPQGLTFADKDEFKVAVADAISQIRRDEAKKAMEQKFAIYANAQQSVPDGKKIYGNPQARFLMQEFSDLECPFCKDFFSVPKEVSDLSKGQVAVEWVHTPLSFHEPMATQEAIVAECVFEQKGNRAFWVAMHQIFDTTGGNGRGSKIMGRFVDDFGLDRDKYLTCINSQEMKDRIAKSRQLASEHGVDGTPALLITDRETGNTTLLSGAQPAQAIMQAIEQLNAQTPVQTDTQVTSQAEQAATEGAH